MSDTNVAVSMLKAAWSVLYASKPKRFWILLGAGLAAAYAAKLYFFGL